MPHLQHLARHIKNYGLTHKPLYAVSIMLLFWALFDGIISYVTPLVITESGLSNTAMGIIIGTSSIAGALFDFILCRVFRNVHFRRVYFFMFAVCLIYPLILWQAHAFWLYLIAMAVWGLYYDLKNFGNLDFVSRHTAVDEHSSSYGVMQVFVALGYMVAPLIAGFLVGEYVDWKPFAVAWIFLAISIVFFVVLLILMRRRRTVRLEKGSVPDIKHWSLIWELRLWKKVGIWLLPALLLTMMLNIFDAFFWTIGPIFAESASSLEKFRGLFMVAFSLPPLIIGWFVGPVTNKVGKMRTAIVSFIIGSLVLCLLPIYTASWSVIAIVFIASCFMAMSWPAISGAYADFVVKSVSVEREIAALEDLSVNIGYVIGPVAAGFMADKIGIPNTFSMLGFAGAISALFLLIKIRN